jgi:hypothetical protein
MARMRMLKPGFFLNDELAEVEPLGRLLFAGLWTIADRSGRLKDRPKTIKVQTLPWDDCDIERLLKQLSDHGFIVRYEAEGERYIAIPTWPKHQTPNIRERESTIPAPCLHSTSTVQAPAEHMPSTPRTEQNSTSNRTDTETVPETAREASVDSSPQSPAASEESNGKDQRTEDTNTACTVTALKVGIRTIIARIDPENSGQLWQRKTPLGSAMARLATYICNESRRILPSLECSEREPMCARLLKAACERMATQHGKEPIRDLPAYVGGLLKRELGDVVGDDLVEELRRAASNGYGKRTGETTIADVVKRRKVSP